jgi:hypothetical protein
VVEHPAAEFPTAFVRALEEQRDALNARFALRMRGGSRIDGGAFLRHLQQAVAPLVGQVHALLPERTAGALAALYDVSLDLFAASLLGPEAKMPWVGRVWSDLLPAAPSLIARDAQQVAGCLSNAAFQIAGQRGARPEEWLARMQQVAPHCHSTSELLEAGKVAAWQAGMVQYRAAALAAAEALRPPLAALALGLHAETPPAEISAILARLRQHVWLTASAAAAGKLEAAIASVGTAGAFAGLGGLFQRPPLVSTDGQQLLVTDGHSHWELIADAYGAWLRRETAPAKATKSARAAGIAVERGGLIRWGEHSLAQPHLAQATSFAACGQTLAVTIPTSHHVFLFSSFGGSL